jgi:RNA polymerase sigma factor for flagellar operon FliA
MNSNALWVEYKANPDSAIKKQIMLQYTNLVHYVIQHSRFIAQAVVDEEDYFQFGVEGLSEAIERFDPEYGTKFETYAIQRIRGKIIDELRKLQAKSMIGKGRKIKAHNVSLSEQYDGDEGYQLYEILPNKDLTPEEVLAQNELKNSIVEGLKELPERDRLIISLYYYEDLNYKEIADILSITVSRVSQIHSRVIKELKQKFVNVHA